jgi:hypothetical protein
MATINWQLPSGERWESDEQLSESSFRKLELQNKLNSLRHKQLEQLGLVGKFPPEFKFNPETGKKIDHVKSDKIWVTPDGGHWINDKYIGFGMDQRTQFEGVDKDSEIKLKALGAGKYEFLVGMFGTQIEQLIAIDVIEHEFKIWLDKDWVKIKCASDVPPQGLALSKAWRAELFENEQSGSQLFIPTDAGLCIVKIDATTLSLTCDNVNPDDFYSLAGQPMVFDEGLLFPYLNSKKEIILTKIIPSKNDKHLSFQITPIPMLEPSLNIVNDEIWFGVTVSKKERAAMWMSDKKVLQYDKSWGGYNVQDFPHDCVATHEAGQPFISSDGSIWFLVGTKNHLQYLHLGRKNNLNLDRKECDRFHISKGFRYFRKDKSHSTGAPWDEASEEPSTTHFFPLLDFYMNTSNIKPKAAIALSMDNEKLQDWDSICSEKGVSRAYDLVFGESNESKLSLIHFYSSTAIESARVFIFQNRIHFYYSPDKEIYSWSLLVNRFDQHEIKP